MSGKNTSAFGAYIRQKRLKTGKSLREVSRELEISAAYLSDVEKGKRNPLGPKHWLGLVHAIPYVSYANLKKLYQEYSNKNRATLPDTGGVLDLPKIKHVAEAYILVACLKCGNPLDAQVSKTDTTTIYVAPCSGCREEEG